MGATVATFTPPWRGAARDQIIVITRLTSCRFVTWINSEEIRILGRKVLGESIPWTEICSGYIGGIDKS